MTIQAYDTANAAGSRAVRIQVMNVNEEGMLELTPDAPHLEGDVMASLMDYDGIMTDPDGMQTITSWEWYRTDNDVPVTVTFNDQRRRDGHPDRCRPVGRPEHCDLHNRRGRRGQVPTCQGDLPGRVQHGGRPRSPTGMKGMKTITRPPVM